MQNEFDGKSVLVTGAASGLGRAVALDFAKRGALLTLADINIAGLEDTKDACIKTGAKTIMVETDLSNPAQCDNLVEAAIAAHGSLYSLVNVAGFIVLAHAGDISVDQWDKVFAINARAPFLLFQKSLSHLLESGGTMVNVASASGLMGHGYVSAYGASKGALIALTKNLATEFTNTPLRINAVAPGAMLTPMALKSTPVEGADIDLLMKGMGKREMAQPEDLTEIVCYLASPKNKRMHGSVVSIDQGVTG